MRVQRRMAHGVVAAVEASGDQDPMLKHIFDARVTSSLEPS